MKEEVIRIVSDVCWLNPQDVRSDQALIEYGLDSARAIDLVVALEEAFGVDIDDETAVRLRTIDDIVAHLLEAAA